MAPEQQNQIVQWLEQIMIGFGAGWVMWLMLGLSVISLAIILERAWFFYTLRDDLGALARDLRNALDVSFDSAQKRLAASPSAEAAVVLAGIEVHHKGADSAETAMEGAAALQRMKLEKRLAYLATLGNNAPFIGLFGTVIGVIGAFKALDQEKAQAVAEGAAAGAQLVANKQVMGSIAEALVATAVGIAVAIPAVAANNYFQRMIKSTLANTEALTKVLLAHLKAVPASAAVGSSVALGVAAGGSAEDDDEPRAEEPKKTAPKGRAKSKSRED
jgi:biopolymer transport protein ExbB